MILGKLSILGTEYTVSRYKESEHPFFKDFEKCGMCDDFMKEIAVIDTSTLPNAADNTKEWLREYEKEIIRHEVIHAYFNESGLKDSSNYSNSPWAKFEEMIDWWAIQGKKVYKTWMEAEKIIDDLYGRSETVFIGDSGFSVTIPDQNPEL